MARRTKDYVPPSRAELNAFRDQKAAAVSEADQREKSFLRNVAAAGDDLEWILLNQAWTQLGYEYFGEWWEKRVLPVLVKLDLRPSQQMADRVIAAIRADEAGLPATQRRTTREIAAVARTSQSRVSRSRPESGDSGSDLDKTAADEPNTSADDGSTPESSMASEPSASGPSVPPPADGPDVTPVHFAGVGCDGATDAANQDVLTWTDDRGEVTCPDCRRNASIPDPPAASSHIDQDALVAEQPGPDSSSDTETDEAPADGEPQPIEPPAALAEGFDVAVATPVEPGIDHPLPPVGEEPSVSGSGAQPGTGHDPGTDEVEGEAEHSPSTDPIDELGDGLTALIHLLDEDRFDPDVRGPMATEAQLNTLHRRVDQLAEYVGLLERWRTTP